MMRRLFIFLFALTTVLSVPVGVSATTPDIKCKTCGKVISKCPYKGKHPVPPSEKKCSKCGKVISKCPYKGNHPAEKKCSTCGRVISKCPYNGNHPIPPKPNVDPTPPNDGKPTKESDIVSTTSGSQPALTNRTFTVNGVQFVMVGVQGGTFQMGSTTGDSDEQPVHQVTLSSYYIGQTEVTQALWKAVMGSNPSYFTGDDRLPVENVSWNDCQDFIVGLNAQFGSQLGKYRFRLPTEAEWEYAARGGRESRGFPYSGSSNLGSVAWYKDNASGETHPVGTKSPNELGIYDMSGNVWEWCWDWKGSYSSSAQTNPAGPASGSNRVLRGGSYYRDASFCRSANRNSYAPGGRDDDRGLRLVLSELTL